MNNVALYRDSFDTITENQRGKSISKLVESTASALLEVMKAKTCYYCPVNHCEKPSLKYEFSQSKLTPTPKPNVDPCIGAAEDAGTSSDFIHQKCCKKTGKEVLLLRIFSYFPKSELKKGWVEIPEEDQKCLNAYFCLELTPRSPKITNNDCQRLDDYLSALFAAKIADDQHRAWQNVQKELRTKKDNPISTFYQSAIAAMEVTSMPICYGCILMFTANSTQEGAPAYLIKQKHHVFDMENSKKSSASETQLASVPYVAMSEKDISPVQWAKSWQETYNLAHSAPFKYALLSQKRVHFKTPALKKLDFSYVLAFPILRDPEHYRDNPNKTDKIFRGIALLFLHPACRDLSFFSNIYLRQYSHAIDSAFRASLAHTIKNRILDEVSKYSHLMVTEKEEFQRRIFEIIGEKVLHVDGFEVRECNKDGTLRSEAIYTFGEKNVPQRLCIKEVIQETAYKKTERGAEYKLLYDTQNQSYSLLAQFIEEPSSAWATNGVILCYNRRSADANNHIIPFRHEDQKLARELGEHLLTLHATMREQEAIIRMNRVLNHEIMNSLDLLYKRLGILEKNVSKNEKTELVIQNFYDSMQLFKQHVIWPRIFAGKYSVEPKPVPVLRIMNKWRGYYAITSKQLYLKVDIPEVIPGDPMRPKPNADPELFEYALSNLIKNAIRYAHMGSTIFLDSRKSIDQIHGEHLRVEVTDYGIGIDETDRARIFDLFFRGKHAENRQGTEDSQGAGLFVVKKCIKEHDWPFEKPTVEQVCKFQAPFLFWLDWHHAWKRINDREIRKEAQEEWQKKKYNLMGFISTEFRHCSLNTIALNEALKKPTYRVSFSLIIK